MSVQQDWLDILGALYATDLVCRRGSEQDWSRKIQIWIGVREPDHWKPLGEQFRRVFGALTYDTIDITFEPSKFDPPRPRQGREAFTVPNCVALLSGGIDSLAGAGQLLQDDRTPFFISHQNSGAVGNALTAVVSSLEDIRPSAGQHTFTAQVSTRGKTENTLRSRSMLYMGIACLVASCYGLDDVFLNENGIMAINAALTEARAGSYSTHTASPPIVRDFGRLASRALHHPVVVRNLLVTSTKPEVVQTIADLGLKAVLPSTVSCWSIGRRGQHCGYCVPCIVRQISCEYAGAPDVDYQVRPMDDIPAAARWRRTAIDNVVHLSCHVSAIAEADDSKFEWDFTEFVNVGDQLTRDESFAMHRRWADQALAILRIHPFSAGYLSF
jgi:7-cyano-7-deazaguanine synthase in queuosine biosynthesis